MDLETTFKTIQKTYSTLSDACLKDLIDHLSIQTYNKNTELVRQGQYATTAYLILSGSARIYYLKEDKDVTDWFAFENEFFTSIVSFFSNQPSSHFIHLLEETTVAEISKIHIDELCKKHQDLDTFLRHVVTDTMLRQQRRLASILFYSAEERYEQLNHLNFRWSVIHSNYK